jgi:hypothetical protein
VYTMDWPGPVICINVYVGTVSRALRPTDPLVVALGIKPSESGIKPKIKRSL